MFHKGGIQRPLPGKESQETNRGIRNSQKYNINCPRLKKKYKIDRYSKNHIRSEVIIILNLAGDNVCATESRFERGGDIGGVCIPESNRDNVKRHAEGRGLCTECIVTQKEWLSSSPSTIETPVTQDIFAREKGAAARPSLVRGAGSVSFTNVGPHVRSIIRAASI